VAWDQLVNKRKSFMKTVHVVTKIARQYEGEYVFVNILGAFKNLDNVNKFLEGKQMRYGETINDIPCVVELGVIQNVEIIDEDV
jgi:hypothetical protein